MVNMFLDIFLVKQLASFFWGQLTCWGTCSRSEMGGEGGPHYSLRLRAREQYVSPHVVSCISDCCNVLRKHLLNSPVRDGI
jgi:hypothetical protein